MWQPSGGGQYSLTDLNALISNGSITGASGWALNKATGIDAAGDIIGTGTFGSHAESFILVHQEGTIAGTVTDQNGKGVPGATVTASGPTTASAKTASDGTYSIAVPPGTYSVQLASAAHTPGSLVVNSTDTAADDPTSLAQGVCDTTPSQAQPTCTLPAAVQVANASGGGRISFDIEGGQPTVSACSGTKQAQGCQVTVTGGDTETASFAIPGAGGGVPQIKFPSQNTRIDLAGTAQIDGQTQPGTRRVEITNAAIDCHTLKATCTLTGLVINGFDAGVPIAVGNHSVVQDDCLNTDATCTQVGPQGTPFVSTHAISIDGSDNVIGGSDPGQGNVLVSVISPQEPDETFPLSRQSIISDDGSGGNQILGNSFDAPMGSHQPFAGIENKNGYIAPALNPSTGNTIGGSQAGDGNTIPVQLFVGTGNVVKGNYISGTVTLTGSANTIGGQATEAGSGAGNTMPGGNLILESGADANVIQGNLIQGTSDVHGIGIEIQRTQEHHRRR